MEERRGEQRMGNRHRRGGIDDEAGGALRRQRLHLGGERHVHQIVDAAAMGKLCALREASRAGRVEDAGIGVGIDGDLGQGAAGRDDLGPRYGAQRHGIDPRRDQARVAENARLFQETGDALAVREDDLRV